MLAGRSSALWGGSWNGEGGGVAETRPCVESVGEKEGKGKPKSLHHHDSKKLHVTDDKDQLLLWL
jgi:hypothetical protein